MSKKVSWPAKMPMVPEMAPTSKGSMPMDNPTTPKSKTGFPSKPFKAPAKKGK